MQFRNVYVLVAILCVVGFALVWGRLNSDRLPGTMRGDERYSVQVGDEDIFVDIADTAETREKGLSDRENLAADEGMLFVFPEDGIYKFWMKDMLIPIDMIWISPSGMVIHIEKNALPGSYPESFGPDTLVRYVLEVPAGFSDTHGVAVGDVVGL